MYEIYFKLSKNIESLFTTDLDWIYKSEQTR